MIPFLQNKKGDILPPMKKQLAAFLKSLPAGILIGIGGMVYLACDDRYIGALLFSVALLSILLFKMNLFTGMIGYVHEQKPAFAISALLALIGNFLASFVMGWIRPASEKVVALCEAKLQKGLFPTVLVDAILCGILIFVCVDAFKKQNRTILVFLCIPTFILCGFEHCIADAYYFAAARMLTASGAPLFLLLVIVGNSIGGLLIPLTLRLINYLEREKTV